MEPSYVIFFDTPLGTMWVWATEVGICGAGFGTQVDAALARRLAHYGIGAPQVQATPLLVQAKAELRAYFDARRAAFAVPLDLRGTEFQLAVWERLQGTLYGETTTYGEIALLLGRPHASQAVGQAVGANPVGVIVPCHRVLGYDGELTGYAGGLDRKAALLEMEQAGLQLRMPFAVDDSV